MEKIPKGHTKLALVTHGADGDAPGQGYRHVTVAISCRGPWYRVAVIETWGSNQVYLVELGRIEVCARGETLSEAIDAATFRASAAGLSDHGRSLLVQAISAAEDEVHEAAEVQHDV